MKGKKRAAKSTDFPRKKSKLGKGKRPAENATNVSFKSGRIVLPSQLASQSHQQPTGKRKLTLEALLRHLNHFMSSMRSDGLTGLRELFRDHPHLLLPNLARLLGAVLGRLIDSDPSVRHSLHLLLGDVFSTVSASHVQSHLPSVVAHLSCGLTHISDKIQLDSLKLLGLLVERYPALLPPHAGQLLPLVVGLITRRKGSSVTTSGRGGGGSGGSKKQVGLAHDPRSKFSRWSSRINVFGLLSRFLQTLLEYCGLSGSAAENNPASAPVVIDIPGKRVAIEQHGELVTLNSQYYNFSASFPCVLPLRHQGIPCQLTSPGSGNAESTSVSTVAISSSFKPLFSDLSKFLEFFDSLFSLLLDSWVECGYSRQPKVAKDTLVLMDIITSLLCSVLKLAASVNSPRIVAVSVEQIPSSLVAINALSEKHSVVFLKQFMGDNRLCSPENSSNLEQQYTKMNLMLCQATTLLAKSSHSSYRPALLAVCAFYGLFAQCRSSQPSLEVTRIAAETVPELLGAIEVYGLPAGTGLECVLGGLKAMYDSCHPLSSAKKCLIHCFRELLGTCSTSSPVFSGFLVPWLEGLPRLLVELGQSAPLLSAFLIDTLTSASSYVSLTHLDHHLATLLGPDSVLSQLSSVAQRRFVELLWLVPTLSPQLLSLVSGWVWLPGERADSAVSSYLVEVLHHRLLKRNDGGSEVECTSQYLVFMMGLLLGGSKHTQAANPTQNVAPLSVVEGHVDLQYRRSIVDTVCECLKSTTFANQILDIVTPTLKAAMEDINSVPVDRVMAILNLVQCLSSRDVVTPQGLVPSVARLCCSVMRLERQGSPPYNREILQECSRLVTQLLRQSQDVLVSVLELLASEIKSVLVEGSGREIAQCYLTLLDSIELNSVMRECSSTIHSTAALITEGLTAAEDEDMKQRIRFSIVKFPFHM